MPRGVIYGHTVLAAYCGESFFTIRGEANLGKAQFSGGIYDSQNGEAGPTIAAGSRGL